MLWLIFIVLLALCTYGFVETRHEITGIIFLSLTVGCCITGLIRVVQIGFWI